MYTPVNPSFYYIKVGCKGVFITRNCFRDVRLNFQGIENKLISRIFLPFYFMWVGFYCTLSKMPSLVSLSNKQCLHIIIITFNIGLAWNFTTKE